MNLLNYWFKNLNLRKKLALLVGLMSAFMIFIGLMGFYISYKENKRLDYQYKNRLLSIQWLDGIRVNLRRNEGNIYQLLLFPDPAFRKMILKDINLRSNELESYLYNYIHYTKLDSYEKKELPVIQQEIQRYKSVNDKTVQLIVNGKEAQAIEYYRPNIAVLDDLNNRLKTVATYNGKMAEKEYSESLKVIRTEYIVILISILFALALAISLASLISDLIGKRIKLLVDKMRQVADGNLDIEPMEIKYKNEVGELSQSFNTMTERLRYFVAKEQNIRKNEQILRTVTTSSISSFLIKDVIRSLTVQTGQALQADRCSIVEYDYEKQTFLPIKENEIYTAKLNLPVMFGEVTPNDITELFAGIIIKQKQAMIINNIDEEKFPENLKNFLDEYQVKSLIAVPIIYGDTSLGIFIIDNISPRQWTQDQIDLVKSIADHSAIVLHQAKLFEETKQAKSIEESLRRIISMLTGTVNINEALQNISREISEIYNADRIIITEFPDKNDYKKWFIKTDFIISPDMIPYEQAGLNPEGGEYWADFTLNRGEILAINNVSESAISESLKNNLENLGIKAIMAVPIGKGTEIWGTISIAMSNPKNWTKDELSLLVPISEQIYLAIKQSELYALANKNAEREELLRRIIEAIRSSLDINEMLKIICDETAKIFNADRAVIVEFPDKLNYKNWITRREYLKSGQIKSFKDVDFDKRIGDFWGENVLENENGLAINNINKSKCPDYLIKGYMDIGVNSIVFVPIRKLDDKWGVLGLSTVDARIWTEEDITLLESIADQIYTSISQAELYSRAKQSAERESLLRAINNEILASNDINEALQGMVVEVGKLFGVDRVVIRFFDPIHRVFSEAIGEYRRDDSVPSALGTPPYPKDVDEYLTQQIIDKKKIFIVDNLDDPMYPELLRQTFKNLRIKSTAAAPMIYKNNPIGTIFLTNIKSVQNWSNTELELLQTVVQQLSIGIHLFNVTDILTKALDRERGLRDYIFETRQLTDHNQIFNHLLDRLTHLFNIERALHLHLDQNNNFFVENEYSRNTDLASLLNKPLLKQEHTNELRIIEQGEVIVINDVSIDIADEKLRKYFEQNNIKSLMIYPSIKALERIQEENIASSVMLLSSLPRKWQISEMQAFRLIVDTTHLIYLEMKTRKLAEDTRNTFLATLTHDLRSPINGEQKALEAILAGKMGKTLDDFSEYLQDIYKTNEELLRIVNNILSVYHYEQGKYELHPEETNITDLINESVKTMRPLAQDQKSDINTNIQDDLPNAMADRSEILRVINNLVSNAVKHNTKGTTINVSARRIDNEIEISVQDNGKGISENEKKNIFQRYPGAKRKIGTGLGLYLSKQITDAHRGRIWFETEEGKGTTFFFTLPVA